MSILWNVFGVAKGDWSPRGFIAQVWAATIEEAFEVAQKYNNGFISVEVDRNALRNA
jgi:hypothetical protein